MLSKTYVEWLRVMKDNGHALSVIRAEYKTDEMCKVAVQEDGRALKYVPKQLRTYELCLEAIKQNGFALEDVPIELKTPELCLIATQKRKDILRLIPKEFLGEDNSILTEKELLKKHSTEELLTSNNPYLRKLGKETLAKTRRLS
jgi:hypothetical protein